MDMLSGTTLTPGLPARHSRRKQAKAPRKRRRIFLWAFLGIQALFLLLVIIATAGDSGSAIAAYCHAHVSQFYSYAQCVKDYGSGYRVGAALGTGFLVFIWAAVDVILGIGYGVYRLARR